MNKKNLLVIPIFMLLVSCSSGGGGSDKSHLSVHNKSFAYSGIYIEENDKDGSSHIEWLKTNFDMIDFTSSDMIDVASQNSYGIVQCTTIEELLNTMQHMLEENKITDDEIPSYSFRFNESDGEMNVSGDVSFTAQLQISEYSKIKEGIGSGVNFSGLAIEDIPFSGVFLINNIKDNKISCTDFVLKIGDGTGYDFRGNCVDFNFFLEDSKSDEPNRVVHACANFLPTNN